MLTTIGAHGCDRAARGAPRDGDSDGVIVGVKRDGREIDGLIGWNSDGDGQ
jgi:hypothetical protein